MGKHRHTSPYTLWLTPEAGDLLKTAAGTRHGMRSAIAEDAIRYYFDPGNDERFSIMARRIERMAAQQETSALDLQVISGTLKMFIELFLILSPPMPVEDREAAQALGNRRFDHFVGEVRKALRKGNGGLAELLFPETESDMDDLATAAFERDDVAGEAVS